MKTTRADWAAQVPWSGVIGAPTVFPMTPPEMSTIRGSGWSNGQIVRWNGSRFVPYTLPATPTPTPPASQVTIMDIPGVATVRQPPGLPYGPTQFVTFREIFDVRQFGAYGSGSLDVTECVNKAIAYLNAAGRGALYFPMGEYRLGDPDEIRVPCMVFGDGQGATKLSVSGDGFRGGASGAWFEVAAMSMISDGTSGGDAINLTDGTSGGTEDMFSFHDLDIRGFANCVNVAAPARRGFIFACRFDPMAYGIALRCDASMVSDVMMLNSFSTSTGGMVMTGDYHQVSRLKLIADGFNWNQGIFADDGFGCTISDSLIDGCVNEAIELSDGSSGTDQFRVENITFHGVGAANPVKFNASKHYVNELHGIGSNTNTKFDQRRELVAESTWNPTVLHPFESIEEEFSLVGARVGDQVSVGAPGNTDFLQITAKVRTNDTIRCTITNTSSSDVTPPNGTWKFRDFN